LLFNFYGILKYLHSKKKEYLYQTLWSDGSKSWEPRKNFVDLDGSEDEETQVCDALKQFEAL
jgi:hypothetical protein